MLESLILPFQLVIFVLIGRYLHSHINKHAVGIGRYFRIADKCSLSWLHVLPRYLSVLIGIFLTTAFIILLTRDSHAEISKYLTLTNLALVFILLNSLFYIQFSERLRTHYSHLSLIKIYVYNMITVLITFIMVMFNTASVDIADIANSQNYLRNSIPMWNAVLLFPVLQLPQL